MFLSFFEVLPHALRQAIDQQKHTLYEELRQNPLRAIGSFAETIFLVEGRRFCVTYTLGKLKEAVGGKQVQELWIIDIDEIAP